MGIPPRSGNGRSLATAFAFILLAGSFLGLVTPPAAGGGVQLVSGHITSNNTWGTGTTIIMTGNVTVDPGVVLTIEPGVTVLAYPSVRLYVNGYLEANGTSTSLITFSNYTANKIWGGIQFNSTSRSSYLQWASIKYTDRGVKAVGSSPNLMNDVIDHAVIGIDLEKSSASVWLTRINYTAMGIHANGTGSPVIAIVTVTTVLGSPAQGIPPIGIFADGLDYIDLASDTVQWVNGTNGANGAGTAGAAGGDGGFAAGIFVNGTKFAILGGNTVGPVLGGRGGAGAPSTLGNGGRGGAGGAAAGIVFTNSATSRAQNNQITSILGGHGGDGGGTSAVGASGGRGGAGGSAVGLESVNATTIGWWFSNTFQTLTAGSAGNGGPAGVVGAIAGAGGVGGDAYGVIASQDSAANASSLTIQTLRGGYGGNGSSGGAGGQAAGLLFFTVTGSVILSANTIRTLTGGTGGVGTGVAGPGGNVTGALVFGDANFNLTTVSANQVSSLTGGTGGGGGNGGGPGGSAAGIEVLLVTLNSAKNAVQSVTGGQGGAAGSTKPAGRGGLAAGVLAVLTPVANSSADRMQSITRGVPGSSGTLPAPALGIGLYTVGSRTVGVNARLVNATFATVSDFDLYLDNYTTTTSLNSTFSSSKLQIEAAANLTVQFFLGVTVLWPNNVTPVAGATVTVRDNGGVIYSRAVATGKMQWLPVTNRVYIDGLVPTWNTTGITVSYLSYVFANDPRTVNLTSSQTQVFTMNDTTPPTSSANALPTWTATRTFSVHYTYSDGFGVGVANITLWYSTGGAWQAYATQAAGGAGSGQFSFTALADGTYQFATTAVDKAGNQQVPSPPIANNTWTIVDTTKPGSHVNGLPAYETSMSFTVSWGPDNGTTDINSYQVQYNTGSGWLTWLGDTKATSGVFTATGQGVVQFRSIATDFAGNAEVPPATNDTWTIVDTVPPASLVAALPAYETGMTFGISWGPAGGTSDIASYAVEFSDDGGSWQVWLSGVTNTSASFRGLDGHTYAFRSLATDRAGNVETKTTNDTWTIVDVTAPTSAVAALPRYETSASFTITWGPTGSTTDIATYAVQLSVDGASWQTWFSGVTNRSATVNGANGHAYAFRSLATDRAGNVESKTGNDTWTAIDTVHPTIVSDAPEGAGVNLTPAIVVTFSEAMDPASTEQAFSLTPSINGAFTWNAAGTVMTFVPARLLDPGTSYAVTVDTTAKDIAGNTLVASKTFQFSTLAPTGGLSVGGLLLPLLLVLLAAVGVALVLLLRRRSAASAAEEAPARTAPPAPAKEPAAIDDVFLLYGRDGLLIKHETRRLRPDIDTDILSGMLTAVQQFVKDSFRGEEGEELNEMTVGQMHILIGRGKWLILAAMITGGDVDSMNDQIKRAIADMEDHNWDRLEDWDGDMELAKVLSPYLRKLIRGEYLPGTASPRPPK